MRDTEGAILDLRTARSYLDDWGDNEGAIDSPKYLALAAKYIKSAAEKDPDAEFVPDGKRYTETADSLSGTALFYESADLLRRVNINDEGAREKFLKAKELLTKAIACVPESVLYRHKLADVLLNLYDQPGALKLAQEALAIRPNDIDARKFLDRIEATPNRAPPTYFEKNPELQDSLMAGSLYISLGAIVIISIAAMEFVVAAITAAGIFFFARYRQRIVLTRAVIDSVQEDIKTGKWRG